MAIDYKLDDLGWYEFERLVQSLLNAEVGLGIESWGGSGDLGRDAYFEGPAAYPLKKKNPGPFVFQCKFIESANSIGSKPDASALAAARKEFSLVTGRILKGEWKKKPTQYAFFTNAVLKPATKQTIRTELSSILPHCGCSIHDGRGVCAWLRKNPDIVRSFPQLLSLRDLKDLLSSAVNAESRWLIGKPAVSFVKD